MNPTEFNKLAEYQQEVARLQKGLVKFNRKLATLPAKYGFKSMDEFIEALKAAGEGAAGKGQGAKGKVRKARTRKRAKITPEVKEKVKVMVKEERTGAEISKQLGLSLPSVQNIKKELGLVKKRGK